MPPPLVPTSIFKALPFRGGLGGAPGPQGRPPLSHVCARVFFRFEGEKIINVNFKKKNRFLLTSIIFFLFFRHFFHESV
jgi:hypothetical protein